MLSKNLKKIRKKHNLSQEDFASIVGVSRQSVSKWESGQSYPEMDKILLICEKYDITIDELMHEDIDELKEEKETTAKVNNFFTEILEGIKKTNSLFNRLTFKGKLKMFFEGIFVALFIALLFVIIGGVINHALDISFGMTGEKVIDFFMGLYVIFALFLGLFLFFFIYKVRYLDVYKEYEVKKEIDLKEKEEPRIIIRDENSSGSLVYKNILKVITFFIKLFAVIFSFIFIFNLIIGVASLILSFSIINSGLLFVGLFLGILGFILLNFVILYIFYNFVFKRKNKKLLTGILIFVGVLLIGIGAGVTSKGVLDLNIISEKVSHKKQELVLDMKKDVEDIAYSHYIIDESYGDKVKVVLVTDKFNGTKLLQKNNKVYIEYIEDLNFYNKCLKDIIEGLNKKELRLHDNTARLLIYGSKENIEKLEKKNNPFYE